MLMLSIPVVLIIPGSGLLDVYGWIGTISTFGFMGAYFLACAGAPVYLRKQQVPTARTTVVAAASMVFLLTALIGNVYAGACGKDRNIAWLQPARPETCKAGNNRVPKAHRTGELVLFRSRRRKDEQLTG